MGGLYGGTGTAVISIPLTSFRAQALVLNDERFSPLSRGEGAQVALSL
jgi:hypothetical protein